MDPKFRDMFLARWKKYFPGADLPITFYYTNEEGHAKMAEKNPDRHCFIYDLGSVRKGRSLCFGIDSVACIGGKRYLGFAHELRPDFQYFLSHGIPGKLEGERYKKSPELVTAMMTNQPTNTAPAKYIVFKRFDKLEESDNPSVVIFFATPDILSGLYTLANYDQSGLDGVIVPMGSGCSSIVMQPMFQASQPNPRAILGMLDVSARKCTPADILTLSIPWAKFTTMVNDMDESFLTTKSWDKVKRRIKKAGER